ncbi:outer membrane lipoprotein Blc [Marinobacterium nitratireducens]|uniref:Outer membrane lipoprotein Blc n=2 Tax=Marinobacterium nitratireducens TaxID=518897 RepID=A0A918DT15_9GAMM|nr:lipocalin family protein [Marinobacterium nitratireducens]GGO80894.1 outer membrane lipoprotein Blc [Marinobacterium nitratireducens]
MRVGYIVFILLLTGCVGMPDKVTPVDNFELDRYLGKWYEIARLDHSFERGLERVTAEYSMRDDGGVAVVNRGYSTEDEAWKVAQGKAYFVEGSDKGYLKVSFFGPFYGSYVVFELEQTGYEYAFVSGPDTSYLWLLSRTPRLDDDVIERFKRVSSELGFDTSELIFVDQQEIPADQSAGY